MNYRFLFSVYGQSATGYRVGSAASPTHAVALAEAKMCAPDSAQRFDSNAKRVFRVPPNFRTVVVFVWLCDGGGWGGYLWIV